MSFDGGWKKGLDLSNESCVTGERYGPAGMEGSSLTLTATSILSLVGLRL